ncbi:MAG: hypothetical protein V8R85_04680 [Frisingicoccus sp.]
MLSFAGQTTIISFAIMLRTNHSFVNGIVLVEDQEKALSAGDRILLGNEEFIFKLQEK